MKALRPVHCWLRLTRYMALALACWLALLAPSSVTAQALPPGALTDAMVSLAQFRQQAGAMRAAVQQPLGPFRLESHCSWCSEHAWWGLGSCTRTTSASWGGEVDFSWTRQQLHDILARAEQDAGAFDSAFAPTRAWMDGLPAFSASFDAAADLVLAVQQSIRQGQPPSADQRTQVTQALAALAGQLAASSAQLQAGTRALATSLQQQSAYRDAIGAAIGGASESAEKALREVEAGAQGHPCQDGVPQQFAAIRADFAASTARIQSAFGQLDARSRAAEQALAVLLGGVVNAQTQMKASAGLVEAARNDQLGSFLEQLHLDAAKRQWSEMAAARAGLKL